MVISALQLIKFDIFNQSGSTYSASVMSMDERETLEDDVSNEDLQSKLFRVEGKRLTPRPADAVCVVDEKRTMSGRGGRVYAIPTPEPSVVKRASDSDMESISSGDFSINSDDLEFKEGNVHEFKYLDNFASVVSGTALKYALSDCTNRKCYEIIKNCEKVRNIFPDAKYFHLTRDNIENMELLYKEQSEKDPPPHNKTKPKDFKNLEQDLKKEELKKKIEYQDDSLLDSDEDYDKDRDDFFRKNKKKFFLINKSGVEEFQRFLEGTLGEKNWNLWVDIDRAKLLVEDTDLQK